jgi:hypothetical protein
VDSSQTSQTTSTAAKMVRMVLFCNKKQNLRQSLNI